jgi:hypothetical protein
MNKTLNYLPDKIDNNTKLNNLLQNEVRLIRSLLLLFKETKKLTAEEADTLCELMHSQKYNVDVKYITE